MRYSGFYMANGHGKEGAKKNVEIMFEKEIKPVFKKRYGIESTIEVTDILRVPEGEAYDDETGECYDIHFIVDLPTIDFPDDTEKFYELERIMSTGLGLVDENMEEMIADAKKKEINQDEETIEDICSICEEETESKEIKGDTCVICREWICSDCTDFKSSGDHGVICKKCSEKHNLKDLSQERITEILKRRAL